STTTQIPYEWTWTGFGDYTVTATAFDLAGNLKSQSMSTPYAFKIGGNCVQLQFERFLMKNQILS
ncbi:MAG: hypothetical protein IMZ53_01720, partial [Thermoplasmata archaeon]|nr:hypothetical protein [Thermoplasmata archaeon]